MAIGTLENQGDLARFIDSRRLPKAPDDRQLLPELTTDPAAPSANRALIYAVDVAGKTQLRVRFATGAVQILAIEP